MAKEQNTKRGDSNVELTKRIRAELGAKINNTDATQDCATARKNVEKECAKRIGGKK